MYEVTGVGKTYRKGRSRIDALRDVELTVEDGEWVAIQGPTGGGKSTLLQLLGALDRPSSGSIRFGASTEMVQLGRLRESELTALRARRIGFVFQSFNLIPTLSALDNVMAGLRPIGVRGEAARERSAAALAAVGLAERADHVPGALSGGQQQRVAVARALVKEPDVILADEPTGNLDEKMRDDIVGLFEEVSQRNVTVVMVTHDTELARRAGRVVHLADGVVSGNE